MYRLEAIWPRLGPPLFVLALSVYWLLRFGGLWAESDSATFTGYIRNFVAAEELIPQEGAIYPNGYLYQAISAFIVAATGLDVVTLQQIVHPLLAVLLVPVAWLAFREVVRNERWAAVCTVLLFTQPDFLFVVMRSSHEMFTRMLMLLAIFLVARIIVTRHSPAQLGTFVLLLSTTVFALFSSNYLLGGSFALATLLAIGFGYALWLWKPHLKTAAGKLSRLLPSMAAVFLIVAYFVMYYVYPPARHDLLVVRQTWDLVTGLFTEGGGVGLGAVYQPVGLWINAPTYLVLTSANWIILAISAALWARKGLSWLTRWDKPISESYFFIWLLYSAFVLQGGLALVADLSGALSSNLQVRLFPSFSMIAVALIGAEAAGKRHWPRVSPRTWLALTAGVAVLSVFSLFKATNEPLVSNKWLFYRDSELAGLRWADRHVGEGRGIWTDFDERLAVAYETVFGEPRSIFTSGLTPTTRTIIVSDVTLLRSTRMMQTPPLLPDTLRVYDNGVTRVYHLRPLSPYQP